MIAGIVVYRGLNEWFPAVIMKAHADGTLDLTIFFPQATLGYYANVPQGSAAGNWQWPDIQIEEYNNGN